MPIKIQLLRKSCKNSKMSFWSYGCNRTKSLTNNCPWMTRRSFRNKIIVILLPTTTTTSTNHQPYKIYEGTLVYINTKNMSQSQPSYLVVNADGPWFHITNYIWNQLWNTIYKVHQSELCTVPSTPEVHQHHTVMILLTCQKAHSHFNKPTPLSH